MIVFSLIWILSAIPRGVSGTDPVLTPRPTATVTENQPLTLTCVYTTNSVPGYTRFKWNRDGNPFLTPWYNGCTRFNLPPSGYTDTCVNSADKYTFTLTTPAITRADDRQTWQCVVDDNASPKFSGVTTVSVQGVSGTNPVLTPGPTATVTENDPLSLTCVYTANSVTGSTTFQWRKYGNPFLTPWYNGCTRFNPPSSEYTDSCVKSQDKYTFTLTTPDVTRADHGQTWQCGVNDGVSSEYKSGVTTVSVQGYTDTCVKSQDKYIFTLTTPALTRADHGQTWQCGVNDGGSSDLRSGVTTVSVQGVSGTDPVLTPGPTATVRENDPLTVTCVYTAMVNSVPQTFNWRKDNAAFITPWYDGCKPFQVKPEGYTGTSKKSSDTYTFTLTTSPLKRVDHQQTWQCTVVTSTTLESGVTTVSLAVPISTVILIPSGSTVSMIVGRVKEFVCETDAGLPRASITWYRNPGTLPSNAVEITDGTSTTHAGGGDLSITRGTLQYTPTRSMDGWRIFCTASNTGVTVTSQKPTLDVQYPPIVNVIPDQRVVEGFSVPVTCTTTPGNPSATSYTWTRGTSSSWSRSGAAFPISSVQKTDADTYTCMASNTMVGSVTGRDTEDFILDVLFPPNVPTVGVSGTSVSGTILEVRGRDLPVTCTSSSNPAPIYTWTGPQLGAGHQGQVLTLTGIQPAMDGQYKCKVTNTMVPTSGGTVQGANQASITVQTLFAPVVKKIPDQAIAEHAVLSITCPILPGYPAATNFRWTRDKDSSWRQTGHILTLTAKREDAGRYTCTANNNMQPTQGPSATGEDSMSFMVSVFYEASIAKFELKNHPGTNITVEETEAYMFECSSTGDPAATVTIMKDLNNVVAQSNITGHAEYPIHNAQCEDSGTYTCTAYNDYNNGVQATTHAIQLNVLCTPRPKYNVQNDINVYKALQDPLVLNLTIISYPHPIKYVWSKLSGNEWNTVTSNRTIEVVNEDLHATQVNLFQSTLNIDTIAREDFGRYKLKVQNGAGCDFIQYFTVIPQVAPQMPLDVDIIPQDLTPPAVTIKWMPGYNGGVPQIFHLQYKSVTAKDWDEKLLYEDANYLGRFNYTITGLSAGTRYVVQIYARNTQGDSDSTRAKEFVTESTESHVCPELSYAGIAGGSVATVVVVLILVGVDIFFVRRRYNGTRIRETDNKTVGESVAPPDSTTYDELSPDRQTGAGAYEMIQNQNEGRTPSHVYTNAVP